MADSTVSSPNPWAYVLAYTIGTVPASAVTIDSPHFTVVPLVDYVSPISNPSSVYFRDTDPAPGLVGGTIVVGCDRTLMRLVVVTCMPLSLPTLSVSRSAPISVVDNLCFSSALMQVGLPAPGSLGDATHLSLFWYNQTCSTVLGRTICTGTEVPIAVNLQPNGTVYMRWLVPSHSLTYGTTTFLTPSVGRIGRYVLCR